jgi:hypothetical protein
MNYSSSDFAAFLFPFLDESQSASVFLSSDEFSFQSFSVGSIGKLNMPIFLPHFDVVVEICDSDAHHSEYRNCSVSVTDSSSRRLFSVPSLTGVDDDEMVSFVLSTSSLPSNYRNLKGTGLNSVTSLKLMPANAALTIISKSDSSIFVQFPLRVGLDLEISLFVDSAEYSASLSSKFRYQGIFQCSILLVINFDLVHRSHHSQHKSFSV